MNAAKPTGSSFDPPYLPGRCNMGASTVHQVRNQVHAVDIPFGSDCALDQFSLTWNNVGEFTSSVLSITPCAWNQSLTVRHSLEKGNEAVIFEN